MINGIITLSINVIQIEIFNTLLHFQMLNGIPDDDGK